MTATSKLSQIAIGKQRCQACGLNKDLAEFPLKRNHMPNSRCKDCMRDNLARARAIRAKNGPKPLPTHELRAGDVLRLLEIRTEQLTKLVREGHVRRVRRGVYDRSSVEGYQKRRSALETVSTTVVPPSPEVRTSALQTVLLKLEGAAILEPKLLPLVAELREAIR